MKKFRKIIRAMLFSLLLVAVGLPVALYLVLATPWAQELMRTEANSQLSGLLGTRVCIDRVNYRPFNTLSLSGVHVDDSRGRPALEAAAVSVRFELWHFLRTGRLVVDYAVLDAPQIALCRERPGAPLNVQPILDRLSPKDKKKEKTTFSLKIGTAVIRDGHLSYNVLSEPGREIGFDPSHVEISELNVYAYVRNITEDSYDVELEALSFRERSGLSLDDFHADVKATPKEIALRSLGLRLPGSSIELAPASLPIDGYGAVARALETHPLPLRTASEATVSLGDFAWAVPALKGSDHTFRLDLDIEASLRGADCRRLRLADKHGLRVLVKGCADGFRHPDSMTFDLRRLQVNAPADEIARLTAPFSPAAARYAARCGGTVTLAADARGSLHDMEASIKLNAAGGGLAADGRLRTLAGDRRHVTGSVDVTGMNFGQLTGQPQFGPATFSASGEAVFGPGKAPEADVAASIAALRARGYNYSGIEAEAVIADGAATLNLRSSDPNATLAVNAEATDRRGNRTLRLDADIKALRPHTLNLTTAREGYTLSGHALADLSGRDIDDVSGHIDVSDLAFVPAAPSDGDALHMRRLDIGLLRDSEPQRITVESDYLNGSIDGRLTPSTLPGALRDMASHVLPALLGHDEKAHDRSLAAAGANDFTFSFTVADAEGLSHFLRLPVQIIYPVTIDGMVSTAEGRAYALVDAPYIQQGDKIIESTVVQASLDSPQGRADLYATTRFPTKKGPMTAVVDIDGALNRFDTSIDWTIDRKIPLNGRINFSTEAGRDETGDICADTRFNPGEITFGDDVWHIAPSGLLWCDRRLTADRFSLTSDTQSISIDGVAGPSPDDLITVRLDNIELAAIFETLEIDKALIGGRATGTFTASQALSGTPLLATDDLHVDGIGYNYCTLGDADVKAHFDSDRTSFFLDADITNPQGEHSRIWGDIFAATESLDLNFDARDVKVGFMKPFMEAFASDVDGYVSGRARLFGTFKNIDMEADIFARDLRLKIDFTNTWYTATDSIHVRPGLIDLRDITIRDVNGHTAMLNGRLRHDFFHNPTFDFRITDARDFLSYNVTQKLSPDWYGTVYGTGGARITGRPGVVEIGVNMRTAPGSVFTFELSDRLEAEQYSFISFRDRTEVTVTDTLLEAPDDLPAAVREYQARMMARNTEEPSIYLMDIQVDITPEARMIIVMDPVGGDRIKASGAGDLRMTYNSADNDLRMYGTYTLERGNYNFTLQDIIIKDFTIDRGSSITFRGDPYSAQLDIDAVYSVNANLSDLDESFLQDKDLNRTNVPVQALLKVTGDMRQPDIAFDLRFPTLTSDIYRKVRSIISTDEMMNRQIIYLLALNRFYTPDYMTATRGNELFSVASSTISSQLSNMLGKLSDNWSIAPNLRSDRGDFSDIEVDVALSSRLLNNRLLFNGNFGYRDRSLNTNQFIGDFDIEYLLNPRGTWRLKAYNRYNDQNYYVRSAATTQGVGIMFRRDFDTLFKRRHRNAAGRPDPTTTPDSISSPDK